MGKIKEKCNCEEPECGGYRYVDGPIKHLKHKTLIQNKTMFNSQEYLDKTEQEFDEKWNLWHETTEQRNAIKSFLRSAIENAVEGIIDDLTCEISRIYRLDKPDCWLIEWIKKYKKEDYQNL